MLLVMHPWPSCNGRTRNAVSMSIRVCISISNLGSKNHKAGVTQTSVTPKTQVTWYETHVFGDEN